jgi:PTH2 family peptidyl-tRNA hydrolase
VRCCDGGRWSLPRDAPANPNEPKMVLVLRGELRLTAGKAAVQAAHAAVLLVEEELGGRPSPVFRAWQASGQRKIAVVAQTYEELKALERKARGLGLATVLVQDAGFTEVAPGTVTCLGIGPGVARDVDQVTGHLSLL